MKGKSVFQKDASKLAKMRCEECHGLGYTTDAEPGDIYYNTISCSGCFGTGYEGGRYETAIISDSKEH